MVPIINWFGFVFFHGTPNETDMLSIYNNVGLVGALNLAMLGGAATAFTFADLQKAGARFQPGGKYGCLAFGGPGVAELVDYSHYQMDSYPFSTDFGESVIEAVMTTLVSLFGAVMLLIGVSSVGNEAELDIARSKDSGGPFQLRGRDAAAAKALGIKKWWALMKWPPGALMFAFLLSIMASNQVLLNIVTLVVDHRAFANACQALGWVSTGEIDEIYGELFTCTNGDGRNDMPSPPSDARNRSSYANYANYDPACFVTVRDTVAFTELTIYGDSSIDLTGGEINYIARANVSVWIAILCGVFLPILFVGGYASLYASSSIQNGTVEDASAAAEVMKPYEAALTAAGLQPEHFENVRDLGVFNSMLKEALTAAGQDSPGARADIIAACTDPERCKKIITRRNSKASGGTKASQALSVMSL